VARSRAATHFRGERKVKKNVTALIRFWAFLQNLVAFSDRPVNRRILSVDPRPVTANARD